MERYCSLGEPARLLGPLPLDRRRPSAPAARAQRADLHVGPRALVAHVVEPQEPPPFAPTKTGTARTSPTPSAGEHPALGLRQLRRPCSTISPRRPSTSIQREKSGRVGVQVVRGVVEDLADAVRVPFGAQVHPQPAVGTAACSGRGRRGRRRGRCRGARAPRRSDRARPRPARSARSRTRTAPRTASPIRPEPPSRPYYRRPRPRLKTAVARRVAGACYPLRTMPDYKEVLHERLYVRVPGTDKLRKTAAARLKHLLANGWRETDRQPDARPRDGPVRADRPRPDEGAPAQVRAPRSGWSAALAATVRRRRPPRPPLIVRSSRSSPDILRFLARVLRMMFGYPWLHRQISSVASPVTSAMRRARDRANAGGASMSVRDPSRSRPHVRPGHRDPHAHAAAPAVPVPAQARVRRARLDAPPRLPRRHRRSSGSPPSGSAPTP